MWKVLDKNEFYVLVKLTPEEYNEMESDIKFDEDDLSTYDFVYDSPQVSKKRLVNA
jgi:hypothetical protein